MARKNLRLFCGRPLIAHSIAIARHTPLVGRCLASTDDPEMFDTDLTREYEAATSLGLSPRLFYEAGVAGAMCDDANRERLRKIGEGAEWP